MRLSAKRSYKKQRTRACFRDVATYSLWGSDQTYASPRRSVAEIDRLQPDGPENADPDSRKVVFNTHGSGEPYVERCPSAGQDESQESFTHHIRHESSFYNSSSGQTAADGDT